MREGRGVRGARDPQTQWLTDTGAVDPWRPRHTLTPSPSGAERNPWLCSGTGEKRRIAGRSTLTMTSCHHHSGYLADDEAGHTTYVARVRVCRKALTPKTPKMFPTSSSTPDHSPPFSAPVDLISEPLSHPHHLNHSSDILLGPGHPQLHSLHPLTSSSSEGVW